METVICRVGFCAECAKSGRPHTGQRFITFGTDSQSYAGEVAKRNGVNGFCPHLYALVKVSNTNVYYQKLCCMVGHGTLLDKQGENYFVYTNDELWSEVKSMTITNWNKLVEFTDTGLKI